MPEVRRRRRPRSWRRLRRLSRNRRFVLVVSGVGGAFVLWLIWAVFVLWSTSSDLREAADRAEVMKAALLRADAEGAREAMKEYQDAVESAESRTSGTTWSVFETAPVLGDDARGVALAASVLADLGRDGLPPVADAAEEVSADAFQPSGHVFPLERITAMVEPARQSEAAFARADDRLAEVDSSKFVGPVQGQFDSLRALVTDARATLGSTYRAARLMPRLLGAERPRYFLMVLQNNAELRSSGGLPGALSLLRARDGRVDIVAQTDMSDIGEATADLELGLTEDERELFGSELSRIAVNSTLTPDFPRAAELIHARWQRAMGSRLDGMIFVDPVAVSYLLRGTGQVPVPGQVPVSEANVVATVENQIYVQTPDRDAQSDYQQAVAKAVFNAFADGRGDTVEAIRGLVAAVQEGRVKMHFFTSEDQDEIAGTRIAGEFPREAGPEPRVGIYVNDSGPTKMQYYLEYDAALFARSCVGGVQDLAGSIEFVNNTPAGVDLPPSVTGEGYPGVRVEPGQQLLVIYLTSPIDGEIRSVSIDGQAVRNPAVQEFAGRSVATIAVRLDPGQRQLIEFVLRTGRGQTGDADLEVTPGAFRGSSNTTVPSACTTY